MMDNQKKSKSKTPNDSSPAQNPRTVKGVSNQTTMTNQNRFPWTTLIIILLLIVIAGAIFLLARA